MSSINLRCGIIFATALLGITTLHCAEAAETQSQEQTLSLRISPAQYQQTIRDIFGRSITIDGRFETEARIDGLLAVGARAVSFSDAGLERYDDLARSIATQVVSERHRAVLIPCKPQSATTRDDACATQFLSTAGRLLYRRPLSESETENLAKVAAETADVQRDFYYGLSVSLADMLISPNFLFRHATIEPDPARAGGYRLDAFSKATLLSSFLWNSAPDDALLKVAESGEIHSKEALKRQVDRMIDSPAVEGAVRAFFADMLGFEQFEILAKDAGLFPQFTTTARDDAQEQTLRTIVDHLVRREGDYRDLFTTPRTFLTQSLAALYGVPLVSKVENGQPAYWQLFTYPEGDARAGLLAHASFVALHSPAARSSPTLRGKALRENLLCQRVPEPPGNVDFTVVEGTHSEQFKTARQRLNAHATEPMCTGCHKITDPIGFALENFNAAGAFRTTENGVPIDTSGELNGVKFVGPAGLAKAFRDDPATTACVARRAFAFGAGRLPATNAPEWKQIERQFADSEYNFKQLLRQIALSDLFYKVVAAPTTASNDDVRE